MKKSYYYISLIVIGSVLSVCDITPISNTEVIVEIEIGGWCNRKQRTFIFPRNYHNLVKIG